MKKSFSIFLILSMFAFLFSCSEGKKVDFTKINDNDRKQGELYGECYPNETCNEGLVCDIENNVCFKEHQKPEELDTGDTNIEIADDDSDADSDITSDDVINVDDTDFSDSVSDDDSDSDSDGSLPDNDADSESGNSQPDDDSDFDSGDSSPDSDTDTADSVSDDIEINAADTNYNSPYGYVTLNFSATMTQIATSTYEAIPVAFAQGTYGNGSTPLVQENADKIYSMVYYYGNPGVKIEQYHYYYNNSYYLLNNPVVFLEIPEEKESVEDFNISPYDNQIKLSLVAVENGNVKCYHAFGVGVLNITNIGDINNGAIDFTGQATLYSPKNYPGKGDISEELGITACDVVVDPCDPNPCLNVTNSPKTCTVVGNTYRCECDTDYYWNGSTCGTIQTQTVACRGLPSYAEWNTVSEIIQTWDDDIGAWIPFSEGSYNEIPSTNQCRYKCKENYSWVAGQWINSEWINDRCVADKRTVTCTDIPENAEWNTVTQITQTWNGSEWKPANQTVFSESAGTTNCYFKCKSGYEWNYSLSECVKFSHIVDSSSGLMWSMRANTNYTAASSYCENLIEGGFTDWRLPTISELRTLIQNCDSTVTGGSCTTTDSCLSMECSDGVCSPECYNDSCNGCDYDYSGTYSKLGDRYELVSSSSLHADYYDGSYLREVGFNLGVDFSNGSITYSDYNRNCNVRCVR